MPRILAIDDDADALRYVTAVLAPLHDVIGCSGGAEGIARLQSERFEVVITDLTMPPPDGFHVLRAMAELPEPAGAIVLTVLDRAGTTLEALRLGAREFVVKPATPEDIHSAVARCLGDRIQEPDDSGAYGLVGSSKAIRRVRQLIPLLASSTESVLVVGETGTGKELLARAIHDAGPRSDKPFVAHNMAATPTELAESLFFGHLRGAFSGAHADHSGLFEQAHGGTLFLDEVDSLPLVLQSKLLRALDCGRIQRVGGAGERPVDVRIVAASAVDPGELAERGAFRADLYYRLRQLEVVLPPLREHMEDVPALVRHVLSECSRTLSRPVQISALAGDYILAYHWPGNVRELRHALRGAALLAGSGMIFPRHLPRAIQRARRAGGERSSRALLAIESEHIIQTLQHAAGNRSRASHMLGIDRGTLARRLKRLGL